MSDEYFLGVLIMGVFLAMAMAEFVDAFLEDNDADSC